jgi:hypothetical protein
MNAATLLVLSALHMPAHGGHDGRPDHRHNDDRRDDRHGEVRTCPANVVAAFDQLDDALRHMANDVEGLKRKQERGHLRDEVKEALERSQRARRVACRETRDDAPDVIVVHPAPQPAPQPVPVVVVMGEPQQRELVTVVRREAFDDGRLGVLALGVRDVCVTSAQARDLVKELTFSQARIDAVRMLAPRIVDRDRSHVVLESLTFDSDRKAVRQVLTSTSPAPQCVIHRS